MTEKRMFEGAKEVFRGTADNHLIGCGKEILLAIVLMLNVDRPVCFYVSEEIGEFDFVVFEPLKSDRDANPIVVGLGLEDWILNYNSRIGDYEFDDLINESFGFSLLLNNDPFTMIRRSSRN